MQIFALAFVWLAAFVSPQQPKAKLELFVRSEGTALRAAVRIKVSPNWHLYAPDLGDPNAVGTVAELTFEGADVRWSEARWPEPEKEKQPFGQDGKPATANVYYGTVVVYRAGEASEGADLSALTAKLEGQTCEDGGTCIQFSGTAKNGGAGADALFEKFPADLKVAAEDEESGEDEFEPFEDPEAHAKVELFTRAEAGEALAAIRIDIEREWHLFHEKLGPPDAAATPTTVTLGGDGIEWGTVAWPEPHKAEQAYGLDAKPTWVWQHEGTIVLYARGKLAPGADASKAHVEVTGQTCDPNVCTQFEASVESSGRGPDALFANFPAAGSASSTSSPPSPSSDAPPQTGLLEFLGLAVFWGIFSLLMPCTYPMIPITISFFTKQASQAPGKRIQLSLLYGLGIVLIFILIGVLIGRPITDFATHPITNLVIGVLFVVFALSLLGLFNLQPPAFLMNLAGQARSTGGYLGVFFMGATLVITSFTCTAPFVGSLLAYGATSGEMGRVVLGMGTFGLTMAIPFVALSLVPGKLSAMPRAGEWMNTLKVTLGFVELAAALKFFSNAEYVYQWFVLPRELFLMLWFGILLVTAVYLLGLIRYHGESGEIGGGRLVAGLSFFLFALYCLHGALGNKLDAIMTAVAPPYSAARTYEGGGGASAKSKDHEIVKDDFEAALAAARSQGKKVLVNFTGFT
jgi:thiol:disulfide interchange protein DsbD